MLTIIDEWTRDRDPTTCCIACEDRGPPDHIRSDNGSEFTAKAVAALFVDRGPPDHIRSDNGSEFTAKAVRDWLA